MRSPVVMLKSPDYRIGRAARERVLAGHTSDIRAGEFERAVELAATKRKGAKVLAAEG